MIYDNEITILFNVVNTRTRKILGETFVPHILRIPSEIITKDVDSFLETYEPLLCYLKEVCKNYEDWKYSSVEYYNIQEDILENVLVKDVIPVPEEVTDYVEHKIIEILEECLSKFNIINVRKETPFKENFNWILCTLASKGMTKTSVFLYVLSKAQETEDQEIIERIQKFTKL